MKRSLINALYLVVLGVALPWLLWRRLRTGRYRAGIKQKLMGQIDTTPVVKGDSGSERPRIWLHGVSVGEVQLLIELLERLAKELPGVDFALSTTTESGMKLASERLRQWSRQRPSDLSSKANISLFYQPFDFSWAVRNAFQRLRPSLIVLGELELWPNWIDEAARQGVPMMVANGRLSERSFRGYQKWKLLTRPMFQKIASVAAQSPIYAERFIACGVAPDRVRVTGSLKFDNVSFARQHPEVRRMRALAGVGDTDIVCVVGSTQDPEEQYAVDAFEQLRDQYPSLRMIIVPRHPDRFSKVRSLLCEKNVRLAVRSEIGDPASSIIGREQSVGPDRRQGATQFGRSNSVLDWEVLLVDSVGELRWWWGLADLALVGGSFGSRGGQNMMEPAAFGANVAFGPNTSNFKDIAELLLAGNASRRVENLDAIYDWLNEELSNLQSGIQRGQRAVNVVAAQQGATDRTIKMVKDLLPTRRDINLSDANSQPQSEPSGQSQQPTDSAASRVSDAA